MTALDFAQARRNMVDGQVRTFDVTDRAVIAAMNEVPRERFVPAGSETLAYGDGPLAVGPVGRRTLRHLLAPMVLARLVQALEIEAGAKVLDVGGGPGYAAVVLARLGAVVVALESDEALQEELAGRLAELGVAGQVTPRIGPLAGGAADLGPYRAILVNGAVEEVPDELVAQLAPQGRLACIRQRGSVGQATLFVRSGETGSGRALFDASAPLLQEFTREAAFAF